MAGAVQYYDIEINEPELNDYGFTKFRLPLDGKDRNAHMMILHNEYDRSKITYCPFDRLDLDKSLKSFEEKLLSEQLIDSKTVGDLVIVFRNECLLLMEDKHNDYFFKDGNGNGKITSAVKKKTKPKVEESDVDHLITDLIETFHLKTLKDTEEIFYYDKRRGIYIDEGILIIKMQLERLFPDISTYAVNEIINHVRRREKTIIDRVDFDPQIEWIACRNCMVNLKTLETKSHSPDFMATVQIPVAYNSSFISDFFEWVEATCPCPKIMKFMHEVMADEDIETVLDFLAYCLWRDFPFHKYMLFNGSGRNGKGVMLEVAKRFLGHQNVSGESLHRILETRFAAAELYEKLANIDADLSKEALKNTGILKKLTGGDYIPAEKKYQHPFRYVNHAKLWFSANEMPLTPDETDAFFARLIIINFPNQFLGDKADPFLIDKLTTEKELSGLLNVVLKRIPKVLSNGIYIPSNTISENYDKYIQSSNPVRSFVEKALAEDPDGSISKHDMYESYVQFCKHKKLSTESEQSFSRKLKKEHGLTDFKLGYGSRSYIWTGVKLIDYTKPEDENQSTF